MARQFYLMKVRCWDEEQKKMVLTDVVAWQGGMGFSSPISTVDDPNGEKVEVWVEEVTDAY